MSDRELEAIRQRKLQELQKKITLEEQKKEQIDGHRILDRVFRGRAWEVFDSAHSQFPGEMTEVEHFLVNLTLAGEISEMGGEQLYAFLKKIGLDVRLNTTIRFLSHGKTELLSEKFKEKTK